MQLVKIYDLLHLTGEWKNADMLNRGTEDRPSLSLFLGGGGAQLGTEILNITCSPLDAWPHEI
jgi:hypothetical protein